MLAGHASTLTVPAVVHCRRADTAACYGRIFRVLTFILLGTCSSQLGRCSASSVDAPPDRSMLRQIGRCSARSVDAPARSVNAPARSAHARAQENILRTGVNVLYHQISDNCPFLGCFLALNSCAATFTLTKMKTNAILV